MRTTLVDEKPAHPARRRVAPPQSLEKSDPMVLEGRMNEFRSRTIVGSIIKEDDRRAPCRSGCPSR